MSKEILIVKKTPVIALIGQPNVGKSSLFNVMTKTRRALVYDAPGVTRDRQYSRASYQDQPYLVIDTGGLTDQKAGVESAMADQTAIAIDEADLLFFMVDARQGVTVTDQAIAQQLRQTSKPVYIVVNKTDGLDPDVAVSEFYQLGFAHVYGIAAAHRRGIHHLLSETLLSYREALSDQNTDQSDPSQALLNPNQGIRFSIVGRPNVGKSTLVNRIMGEDRVVVYDMPGTTLDSIEMRFCRDQQDYTIVDTAGIRRRKRVKEALEKFSVVKTLETIESSHVVVIVVDAQMGLTDQDLHLIGFALEAGRSMVVAINKWDGLSIDQRQQIKSDIKRRLTFIDGFVDIHFISALHGTNVGHVFRSIQAAYQSAMKKMSTNQLTAVLKLATQGHPPPRSGQQRIKLKYAHAGGHNPPLIVIHGNQVDKLPAAYKRYLENYFRQAFELVGTPIRLVFKQPENPYQ